MWPARAGPTGPAVGTRRTLAYPPDQGDTGGQTGVVYRDRVVGKATGDVLHGLGLDAFEEPALTQKPSIISGSSPGRAFAKASRSKLPSALSRSLSES